MAALPYLDARPRRRATFVVACALAVTACRSSNLAGVRVTLEVADGSPRPEYVTLRWFAPNDDVGSTFRYPEHGSLPAGGRALGSVFFEIPDRAPGERRVLAVGVTGARAASFAAERIDFESGQREVTLVLGPAPQDSDGDGIPDAIDDDCGSPSCAPRPRHDAGAPTDAQAAVDAEVDAPVTSGPVDAGREKMPLATACTAADDCASGFCVDGVCCESGCAGVCSACNLPGAQGRCTPIASGEDPADECASDAASTCAKDGTCDGKGACRLLAEGTKCAPATCAGTAYTPARTCDGKGACRAATQTTCGGYVCETSETCRTRCTTNADCSTGNVCVQGACTGPKPIGAACASGSECVSEQCQQGVCCTSACAGTCFACDVPGSVGSCVPIPTGQDPLNQCADTGAMGCGTDGACDGMGKCRSYASGTSCAPATCSGTTATAARTCDGNGTCRAAVTIPCAPFTCGGAQCRTSCTDDTQCSTNAVCVNAVCVVKRGNGESCKVAHECGSGFCVGGLCCDRACTGTCEACNLVNSVGTCKLVPAGADPLNQCSDAGGNSCGTDGTCDGNGACRLYAAGTACGSGTCTAATQTPPPTCNGTGTCVAASPVACGRYQCAATSCRTGCLTDADCVAPNACGAGECGGLRGEYFNNQDLTASVLVRVDPRIYFDWGTGAAAPGVDSDSFSVRWTGTLTPEFTEPYELTIGSDDGVRLWIDGALVVDAWLARSYAENTATVSLVAGHAHDVKIEYYEQTGDASVQWFWASPSQPREIVPASALTPAP